MRDYTRDVIACMCWFVACLALVFALFFGIGLMEPNLRPMVMRSRQVWCIGLLIVMALACIIAEVVLMDEGEQPLGTMTPEEWQQALMTAHWSL